MMNAIQEKLDYADAVGEWALAEAERALSHGDTEVSLRCVQAACIVYWRQNRILTSPRVEALLRSAAQRLKPEHYDPPKRARSVCLHVMNEAIPAGGLTAMATRWITNDKSERSHSVALLHQECPLPGELSRAVAQSGGEVFVPGAATTILERSAWLRRLANTVADLVVLHIDCCDVTCATAFGIDGGPPVMLVNHAAHVYWSSIGIVDAVVNTRGSALEMQWTQEYRGAARGVIVPIPLPDPAAEESERDGDALRKTARAAMGIPESSVVLLTIGAHFKFAPTESLDFVATMESVLERRPDAYLIAVGFSADVRWSSASRRVGSRILTPGVVSQTQLAHIRQATDIYVEGFPFGTTTSLLEAAATRIPVVLAPSACPPPYGSDGIALDGVLERPGTLEAYKSQIDTLIADEALRRRAGRDIAASVMSHHAGVGWRQHLESALGSLPAVHHVKRAFQIERTPPQIHEYWSFFVPQWTYPYERTLESTLEVVLRGGLRPRLSEHLRRACVAAARIRRQQAIPLWLLEVLFVSARFLPARISIFAVRLFSFLFREDLHARVTERVLGYGKEHRPRYGGQYSEYRQAPRNDGSSSTRGRVRM